MKQEQEDISRNHVQTFTGCSVRVDDIGCENSEPSIERTMSGRSSVRTNPILCRTRPSVHLKTSPQDMEFVIVAATTSTSTSASAFSPPLKPDLGVVGNNPLSYRGCGLTIIIRRDRQFRDEIDVDVSEFVIIPASLGRVGCNSR